MSKVTYKALTLIWSLQHKKYFEAGEKITWDTEKEDLPDFDALVDKGVIAPVGGSNKHVTVAEDAKAVDGLGSEG